MILLILILAIIIVFKYKEKKNDSLAIMDEHLKNRLIESEELYLWNSRKN